MEQPASPNMATRTPEQSSSERWSSVDLTGVPPLVLKVKLHPLIPACAEADQVLREYHHWKAMRTARRLAKRVDREIMAMAKR